MLKTKCRKSEKGSLVFKNAINANILNGSGVYSHSKLSINMFTSKTPKRSRHSYTFTSIFPTVQVDT